MEGSRSGGWSGGAVLLGWEVRETDSQATDTHYIMVIVGLAPLPPWVSGCQGAKSRGGNWSEKFP